MKKLILTIFFIILIQTVSAIVTNPEQIDVNYQINVKEKSGIEIHYDQNTSHNFPIFNITIEDIPLINFSSIQELRINETKTLNYSYKITEPVVDTYTGKLTYLYKTNISKEPQNYTITVNATGFSPINLTISQNDTIIWENIDTVNHTVTNLNNPDDRIELLPGQKFFRTFTEITNFSYFDEKTSIGGNLKIKSNLIEAFTHTPSFDIPITVTLQFTSSNIETDIIPDTFSIDYNKEDQGVIRLKTNDSVFNVNLQGDWFTFQENDFDLEGTKIIVFTIKPDNITVSDQTNQTYTKEIIITGENLISTTVQVPIFINRANLTDDIDNIRLILRPMTLKEQRAYCEEIDWDDPTCEEYIRNDSYPVYVERTIRPELNESQFIDFIEAPDTLLQSNDRIINRIEQTESQQNNRIDSVTEKVNNLETQITDLSGKINNINEYVLNIKRNKIFSSVLFWIIFIILTIIIGVWRLIVFIRSRKKISTSMGLG